MAKLSKSVAAAAEDQASEWGVRQLLPVGNYLCKLVEVDTTRKGKESGVPYWVFVTETVEVDGQPAGNRLWDNASLSEKAIGRLGKIFEAFGQPTTADTDDMIGLLVTVVVTQETITKGDNAGNLRNAVAGYLPADAHPAYEEFAAQFDGDSANAEDLG